MPDGKATARQILQLVEAQTGQRPDALNTPPPPYLLAPLMQEWCRMSTRRTSNGWGFNAISWPELESYQRQTGVTFTPWEVDVLTGVERAFMNAQAPLTEEE